MRKPKAFVRQTVLANLSWPNEIRLRKLVRLATHASFFRNYLRYGLIGDGVCLEASTRCQLKCPICPTATGENRQRPIGWGDLSFQEFRTFVDRYPGIRRIELSNWGEIFLNPELKEILRYGHEKGLILTAVNGVNLNTAKDEVLEAVVKYELRLMTVSLDGATNETYRQYRKGGNLDKVLARIQRINEYKERYGTRFPEMIWQFILFGHNQHEISLARDMAARMKMTFQPKLNAYSVYSPIQDEQAAREASGLDVTSRKDFKSKSRRYYGMPCSQLWFSPQINWDGKLLGCCVNGWMDFGNVFASGLRECLQGERYEHAKQMLMGRKKAREDIPCTTCPYYRRDDSLMFGTGTAENRTE